MTDGFNHIPVLLRETISSLNIRPDGIYVDGTTGGGGHSEEILKKLGPDGRLICFDQDQDALHYASERLMKYGSRVSFVHSNFRFMKKVLAEKGISRVNGIVLDLGVSSYQLDHAERGFSYREDAPLDMRMDRDGKTTARDIVNNYSEQELCQVIRDYGEERFASNIARRIVRERQKSPVETTLQLAGIVKEAIPSKYRRRGGHPAKKTFQAIRIELNEELDVLKDSLDDMIQILDDNGRICVITFHSLEDRIVKSIFHKNENPCTCPPSFPVCVCGKIPTGKVITKKPILPGEEEIKNNSRSKSAKLRVFERQYGLRPRNQAVPR